MREHSPKRKKKSQPRAGGLGTVTFDVIKTLQKRKKKKSAQDSHINRCVTGCVCVCDLHCRCVVCGKLERREHTQEQQGEERA